MSLQINLQYVTKVHCIAQLISVGAEDPRKSQPSLALSRDKAREQDRLIAIQDLEICVLTFENVFLLEENQKCCHKL